MATVITQIKTDQTNYSRWDDKRNVITAICYVSTPQAGSTITAQLYREDGYGSVLSVTSAPLAGTEQTVLLTFPLESCTDPNYPHVYRARRGRYTVRAGGVVSPVFTVSLVSLRRLRDDLCKGLPLLSGETVGVQDQPRVVTGVQVLQIAPDMPQSTYVLSYTAAGTLLAWDGGGGVNVGAGGDFTLIDKNAHWWVRVRVQDWALPAGNQAETLVVTEQRMTDDQILAEIENATRTLEDAVQVYLEPTQVCTELLADYIHEHLGTLQQPTNDFQDVIKSPVPYIRPTTMTQWIAIKLPLRGLIQLEELFGFLNQTQAVYLDRSWWLWDEKSGLVQLVPNQNATINWANYSGFFYSFLMGSFNDVPNFWHAKVTCGIRALTGREANTLVALEYMSAINVLRQAALHAKPGYTNESLARDGLTQSIAYAAGPGGVYSQIIDSYEKWLAENLGTIKRNRRGMQVRFF
jgi:hypothetical protein